MGITASKPKACLDSVPHRSALADEASTDKESLLQAQKIFWQLDPVKKIAVLKIMVEKKQRYQDLFDLTYPESLDLIINFWPTAKDQFISMLNMLDARVREKFKKTINSLYPQPILALSPLQAGDPHIQAISEISSTLNQCQDYNTAITTVLQQSSLREKSQIISLLQLLHQTFQQDYASIGWEIVRQTGLKNISSLVAASAVELALLHPQGVEDCYSLLFGCPSLHIPQLTALISAESKYTTFKYFIDRKLEFTDLFLQFFQPLHPTSAYFDFCRQILLEFFNYPHRESHQFFLAELIFNATRHNPTDILLRKTCCALLSAMSEALECPVALHENLLTSSLCLFYPDFFEEDFMVLLAEISQHRIAEKSATLAKAILLFCQHQQLTFFKIQPLLSGYAAPLVTVTIRMLCRSSHLSALVVRSRSELLHFLFLAQPGQTMRNLLQNKLGDHRSVFFPFYLHTIVKTLLSNPSNLLVENLPNEILIALVEIILYDDTKDQQQLTVIKACFMAGLLMAKPPRDALNILLLNFSFEELCDFIVSFSRPDSEHEYRLLKNLLAIDLFRSFIDALHNINFPNPISQLLWKFFIQSPLQEMFMDRNEFECNSIHHEISKIFTKLSHPLIQSFMAKLFTHNPNKVVIRSLLHHLFWQGYKEDSLSLLKFYWHSLEPTELYFFKVFETLEEFNIISPRDPQSYILLKDFIHYCFTQLIESDQKPSHADNKANKDLQKILKGFAAYLSTHREDSFLSPGLAANFAELVQQIKIKFPDLVELTPLVDDPLPSTPLSFMLFSPQTFTQQRPYLIREEPSSTPSSFLEHKSPSPSP